MNDPVLVRRAQVARAVSAGQRLGYGLFALAIVLFIIGFATGFAGPTVPVIVICLIVGSAVLAPAIVFSYGVKAAEKEDRLSGH
jgi:uncharacterized membrane protein (Fun14 family)